MNWQVFPAVQILAHPCLGSLSASEHPVKWQVQTVAEGEEILNDLYLLQKKKWASEERQDYVPL